MAARATATGTAIVAARATLAVTTAIGGTATGFATGAEVAELAGQFRVERIVEADGQRSITGGCRLGRGRG